MPRRRVAILKCTDANGERFYRHRWALNLIESAWNEEAPFERCSRCGKARE